MNILKMLFKNKIYLTLALVGVIALSFVIFKKSSHHDHTSMQASTQKDVYFCSMHPHITSDKPGQCPICHMDLQKMEPVETEKKSAGKKILFYRHPMQPDVTSPVPSKDEMGMDYIPVYEEEANQSDTSNVSGRASFQLSHERQQLIGVTSTEVTQHELTQEIRASGKVAFDPELFTAIEEYRQSLAAHKEMSNSTYADLKEQTEALLRSTEIKLQLLGLNKKQIEMLGKVGSDSMNLLLPKGEVWIYAEVFEYEIAGLKSGQRIEVLVPSIPGKTFSGTLSSISPILNAPTRTFRVRAEVPDPDGELRPDTFVNVKIKVEYGKKLAVPLDSVIHTGDQNIVFVIKGKGIFEPRAVTVGVKTKDYYEIISGLTEGEIVATAANFLIDSESRLRSVIKELTQGKDKP